MFNPSKTNLSTGAAAAYAPPAASQFPQQPVNFQMCQSFTAAAVSTKNEYAPLMNIQQQQQMRFQVYNQANPVATMPQHCKSYSLPANFQQEQQQFMMQQQQQQSMKMQPPPRQISINGDIPLPNGWELEKTPTGQAYYINHVTKSTSWEDPRKLLNLPPNQVDINIQTRAIINSIPLPSGWEEARTAVTNEVYFINHATKTTTWEDPRLTIYMQQQQNSIERNFGAYDATNRMLNSSSTSSICSSTSTSSSSQCSSFASLSSSLNDVNKISKKETIKKNLDDLLTHKNSIIKQIDDLTKQEMSIKSKLSPQEIDSVLKVLNNTTTPAMMMTVNKNQHFNKENIIMGQQQGLVYTGGGGDHQFINENTNVNNLSNTSMSSDNNDMDTTLVTEN